MASLLAGIGSAASTVGSGIASGLGGAASGGGFGSILGNVIGSSLRQDLGGLAQPAGNYLSQLIPNQGTDQTGAAANAQQAQAPNTMQPNVNGNPSLFSQPIGSPQQHMDFGSLIQRLLPGN